jgi:uncharacterized protein
MGLLKNIEIVDLALFLKKENILIISDLQLGYEDTLLKKGVMIPKNQFNDIYIKIEKLLKLIKPNKLIINGDFKHEFGLINKTEWKILKLIDMINEYCELVLIKGNHDTVLESIVKKKDLRLVNYYFENDVYICHGHEIPKNKEFNESKFMIIGHEHPALMLEDGGRREKFKCFLKGKYSNKHIIVMPSYNELTIGSDILNQKRLSPFLKNIDEFEVFVVSEKILEFGKVKDIK